MSLSDSNMSAPAKFDILRDGIAAKSGALQTTAPEKNSCATAARKLPCTRWSRATTLRHIKAAGRVLKVVDEQAAEWIAAVDADPGRFGNEASRA